MLPALYDTSAPLGSVSNRWVPRSSTPATRSGGPEAPPAAVLGVVLLVVADPLHEDVHADPLAVRDLVDLSDEPGVVDQDPRVGDEARGGRADVLVDLEDLLDGRGLDEPGPDLLVGQEDDPVLESQAVCGGPASHGAGR